MVNILEIKGKVKYKITLDPGVWIFDDRRIDLDTYFEKKQVHEADEVEYEQKMSNYWNREIREGNVAPPTLKTEKRFEKEKVLTSSFGIPLEPFLKNAEPEEGTSELIIETKKENVTISLKEGSQLILGFSNKGKPLREDGPVHIYFNDGSNVNNPIKNVIGFIVK